MFLTLSLGGWCGEELAGFRPVTISAW